MLPDFIGLGANRSGSTWLSQNLMQHPQLCLPKKEMHFFNKNYDQGIAYYEAEFASCPKDKFSGEVTPAYFHTEEVPSRISQCVPNAKLFVSLRNPVSRAYSQYWRMIATGQANESETFEDVLRDRELVLWTGRSYEHLTRYYQYFDKDNIAVILFEDIKNSPSQVLSELFSFLNVDANFESPLLEQRINAAASINKLARSKTSWYANRILTRLGFHNLSSKVEENNRSTLPTMKLETRRFLVDYYRDDVTRLQDLLQRDLQSWLLV